MSDRERGWERGIRWLADGTAVVLAVVAAVVLTARTGGDSQGQPRATTGEPHEVPDWERVRAGGLHLGPETAQMVIVEFIDYECPFCRRMEAGLQALRQAYGGDLAVIYRHLPIPGHAGAYPAARMAVCAAEQGQFQQVHSLLLTAITLEGLDPAVVAQETGLSDPGRFVACVGGGTLDWLISRDVALAEELGVSGTPTLIIEGTLYPTPPDDQELAEIARQLLGG